MRRALVIVAQVLILISATAQMSNVMEVAYSSRGSDSLAQNSFATFEGTLDIAYGDSRTGNMGAVYYTLVLLNGTRASVEYTGQQQLANCLLKRVVVTGRVVPNKNSNIRGQSSGVILSDTVTLANPQLPQTNQRAAVTGTRKVIMLLLKFSDDTSVPHPPSFYSDLINPSSPPPGLPATVNGFYINASWNQFQWLADVGGTGGVPATNWLTLPHAKSYYANCGWNTSCADVYAIADDGTTAGVNAGINFPSYDNINFVLSNDLDCCAWGGSYSTTLNGVFKNYGATWEPPWGQEAGTYSHEMGHSLGLPHSGWVYYAYDSPWDVMSMAHKDAVSIPCGSYYSDNDGAMDAIYCDNPGDGLSAPYKDYLGWIDSNHETLTSTGSNVTATLDGDALPLGSAQKMIKICITGSPCIGSSAHYFTVEARVKSPYGDGGIPGEGIIIHMFEGDRPAVGGRCFFNSQSGWAWPIDSTPGDYDSVNCGSGGRAYPNYALFNAEWLPGQTYSNAAYGLTINIVSRSLSSFVVAVGSVPASSFDFSLSNSGGVTVTQGSSGSNTVIATLLNGPAQSVGLSCTSGLPAGASCSFNPASGNPTFSSTLTVSTLSSTPTGLRTIKVTGAGGAQSHTTQFTLRVNAPLQTQTLKTGVDSGIGSMSPNCSSGCSETVGSQVTVIAMPSSGWQFSSWSTQNGQGCSSNPCTFGMPNNPVTLNATFTPPTLTFGGISSDVFSASSQAVIVLPDYTYGFGSMTHTSAGKCGGAVAAAVSDTYATYSVIGALSKKQSEVLDTNPAYVSQSTCGQPVGNPSRPVVVVAGWAVNEATNYYVIQSQLSQVYYDSGTDCLRRRDTGASIQCNMSTPGIPTQDYFVLEALKDSSGRTVYLVYGWRWLGTVAATDFITETVLKNPAAFTHLWYVYRWDDATSGVSANAIPDAGDNYTQIAAGP